MKKAVLIILVLALCTALLVAYAQNNEPVAAPQDDMSIAPGEGDGMRLILPQAMDEKAIKLEDVKSIELFDLDGKAVDKKFTANELSDIVKAYNAAMIDDVAYIEMITGNRMVMTFNDGTTINITSYGDESHVVASGENMSYHLISPEIAKILLAK